MQEFFTELAARLRSEGKQADVLIANNVLARVSDSNDFVAGMGTILREDGIAEVEAPYMKDLIDNLEFDTIDHEHVSYFSVTAATFLFERHGLSLNRLRRYPIHGGTFRFTLGRKTDVSDAVRALLIEDRAAGLTSFDYFRDFGHSVKRLQAQLGDLLRGLRAAGKRIAAYGAAAKGTILLNSSGVGADVIDFVADKNPHRQGKLMPGARIPVAPPEWILEEMPDYVQLLAWNVKDGIMRQEAAYLERGGRFIVPIPHPVVVGGERFGGVADGSYLSRT